LLRSVKKDDTLMRVHGSRLKVYIVDSDRYRYNTTHCCVAVESVVTRTRSMHITCPVQGFLQFYEENVGRVPGLWQGRFSWISVS